MENHRTVLSAILEQMRKIPLFQNGFVMAELNGSCFSGVDSAFKEATETWIITGLF